MNGHMNRFSAVHSYLELLFFHHDQSPVTTVAKSRTQGGAFRLVVTPVLFLALLAAVSDDSTPCAVVGISSGGRRGHGSAGVVFHDVAVTVPTGYWNVILAASEHNACTE